MFPTKIVQRKFSGCSKYPCNVAARGFPARRCWRMRMGLSASTPASIPESREEIPRPARKMSRSEICIGLLGFLHQHLADASLVDHLGGQPQPPERHRLALA